MLLKEITLLAAAFALGSFREDNIQFQKCYEEDAYHQTITDTLDECIDRCVRSTKCVAVVFEPQKKLCSKHASEGTAIKCPGKWLVTKTDFSPVSTCVYLSVRVCEGERVPARIYFCACVCSRVCTYTCVRARGYVTLCYYMYLLVDTYLKHCQVSTQTLHFAITTLYLKSCFSICFKLLRQYFFI